MTTRSILFAAVAVTCVRVCAAQEGWLFRTNEGPWAAGWLGMAYDTARNRTVAFGGEPVGGLGITWEWDGHRWQHRTDTGPGARSGAAMAFDPVRNRIVLFGGNGSWSGQGVLGDTWEWDGATWELRSTGGPAARTDHQMVYDAAHQRIVLFGGAAETLPQSQETWAWDGQAWTLLISGAGPSHQIAHGMAYDPMRDRIVVSAFQLSRNETWEFDGTSWVQRTTSEPVRKWPRLAFHVGRQRVVRFGGARLEGRNYVFFSETLEWDGNTWTMLAASGPPARAAQGLVYDSRRDRLIMFGGRADGPGGFIDDTWEYVIDPSCQACDVNCDGSTNQFDVEFFVSVVAGQPPCSFCTADANGDSSINSFDIQSFIECLGG